jgi:hypothetical protein
MSKTVELTERDLYKHDADAYLRFLDSKNYDTEFVILKFVIF